MKPFLNLIAFSVAMVFAQSGVAENANQKSDLKCAANLVQDYWKIFKSHTPKSPSFKELRARPFAVSRKFVAGYVYRLGGSFACGAGSIGNSYRLLHRDLKSESPKKAIAQNAPAGAYSAGIASLAFSPKNRKRMPRSGFNKSARIALRIASKASIPLVVSSAMTACSLAVLLRAKGLSWSSVKKELAVPVQKVGKCMSSKFGRFFVEQTARNTIGSIQVLRALERLKDKRGRKAALASLNRLEEQKFVSYSLGETPVSKTSKTSLALH